MNFSHSMIPHASKYYDNIIATNEAIGPMQPIAYRDVITGEVCVMSIYRFVLLVNRYSFIKIFSIKTHSFIRRSCEVKLAFKLVLIKRHFCSNIKLRLFAAFRPTCSYCTATIIGPPNFIRHSILATDGDIRAREDSITVLCANSAIFVAADD